MRDYSMRMDHYFPAYEGESESRLGLARYSAADML